jgi:2-isopropylmalate synthase
MTKIIDTTLREGMQTSAGTFTAEQSVEIARLLASCGVDAIECGHPYVSERERQRVAAVVKAVPSMPVLAHARACPEDIRAAADTGAAWVGIFLGVNAGSRRYRTPGASRRELFDRIRGSVADARKQGLSVRFTVEDASRTDQDDLIGAFDVAATAGAERLYFSDTTGILEPHEVHRHVRTLVDRHSGIDLEVHLHDDRGLSLANALAGIDAGATWVSASVNALGERAGITDLTALLVNLHLRAGSPLPPPGLLAALSRRVGAYSRSHPDDRRPFVGRNVFHHQARLHVKAVGRDSSAYEILDPALLGRQRSVATESTELTMTDLIVTPPVISAEELRYHRKGPGQRFVLVDDRFVRRAGQYCIARRIPPASHYGPGHVDAHVHHCDSLFAFLGDGDDYRGLTVEVRLGESLHRLESPASVFIPAGIVHSYRVLGGSGTYLNHVLSGSYEESLLDPVDAPPLPGPSPPIHDPGKKVTGMLGNTKSRAWDNIGGLFWTEGRVSARPSRAELDMFLEGIVAGQRCTVVGASTRDLVIALLGRDARVTVLDFSARMCRDLADSVSGIDVRQADITQPLSGDLLGSQTWILSDPLINRFTAQEATLGLAGMASLARPGGTIRTSVKLGRYPMDDRMIAAGRARGTLSEFWDETTSTIDFLAAGHVLEEALLPHGDIDRDLLLRWYRGRGREKRFTANEVRAALAAATGVPPGAIQEAQLPDAAGTSIYSLTVPADTPSPCAES